MFLHLPDTCAHCARAFRTYHNAVEPSLFEPADYHFPAFHALPVPVPLSGLIDHVYLL